MDGFSTEVDPKGFPKLLRRELRSLIGDEVFGWTEPKRGPLKEPAHLSSGGFFPKHFVGEGHA